MQVKVLRQDRQFLHLECDSNNIKSFILSAVYSLPYHVWKNELWEKLKNCSVLINKPWIVLGDFNEILHESERVGGVSATQSRINWF